MFSFIGELWRQRRKMLTPAFNVNVLSSYLEVVIKNGQKAVESCRSKGEFVQDIATFFKDFALNIVCGKILLTLLNFMLLT